MVKDNVGVADRCSSWPRSRRTSSAPASAASACWRRSRSSSSRRRTRSGPSQRPGDRLTAIRRTDTVHAPRAPQPSAGWRGAVRSDGRCPRLRGSAACPRPPTSCTCCAGCGSAGSSRSGWPASSPTACSRWRWRRTPCSPTSSRPRPRSPSALAVVLLPFSVLGPFAGVLLDRWSRRQVLAWANFARVGDRRWSSRRSWPPGCPTRCSTASCCVCLSVNRFLLAGLSASLPHTVTAEDLVTANALTPTAGTLAFIVGLAVGGGIRAARPRRRARRGRHRAARRRRPVRRRGAAGPADPPGPAGARLRPGPAGGRAGGAPRRHGTRRRGCGTCASRAEPGRRAGRDRVAPLLVRHRLGDARAALPQLLLRGRGRRRRVRRPVDRGPRRRRGLRGRGVRDPGGHRADRRRGPGW